MQDPNTPTQGQAQPAPEGGAQPQGSAPATAPTAPQAPDYAALEQEAQGLGSGITLATLPKQYADARQAMQTSQREAAELKRQYESVRPLAEAMDTDPQLADHLWRQAQAYVQGAQQQQQEPYGYEQQPPAQHVPPAVSQAFDPTQRRLRDQEIRIAEIRLERGLDAVAEKHGMSAEEREAVLQRCIQTDSEDAEAVFLGLYGAQRIEQARQEAVKATAQTIQDQNQQYRTLGGTSVSAPAPVDTSQMSPEQLEQHEEATIKDILDNPARASEIANQLR